MREVKNDLIERIKQVLSGLSTSDAATLTVLFLLFYVGLLAIFLTEAKKRSLWFYFLVPFMAAAVLIGIVILMNGLMDIVLFAVMFSTMLTVMLVLAVVSAKDSRPAVWASAALLAASFLAVAFVPLGSILSEVGKGTFIGACGSIGNLYRQYKKSWGRRTP